MLLHNLSDRENAGYTSFGCYWQKGKVRNNSFRVTNAKKNQVESQSRITAYWPDGSIKWSAHTVDAGLPNMEAVEVEAFDLLNELTDNAEIAGILVEESEEAYKVNTGKMSFVVPKVIAGSDNNSLIKDVYVGGTYEARAAYPVFVLEHTGKDSDGYAYNKSKEYRGEITSVEIEVKGSLETVFCFRGNNIPENQGEDVKMPFAIRMYVWKDSSEIKFQHTFMYDGKEERDFLKGMGIRFDINTSEGLYDRHIQFGTDKAHFHEAALLLYCSHSRLDAQAMKKQMAGDMEFDAEVYEDIDRVVSDLPHWNKYSMLQDSAYHYVINKQSEKECCMLTCLEGKRAKGVMSVSGVNSSFVLGIKDFYQKCLTGFEVDGLAGDAGECSATAWFYSPAAKSYDFRHYSTKSFPATCYEGFDFFGSTAYGIAVTSECRCEFGKGVSTKEELDAFARKVQKPPVYVASPEFYYENRAFGYWSKVAKDSEAERWLELQLEKAFEFYKQEIEARDWYGIFNYGDVMHTYDRMRHVWKYDIGGFAWQNTELVPTYWLWLYFLRTGREDVYTLIEAMSRHCSEVDIYHFGVNKGLGSRHNVIHWGCPCKEPRIAMAGHHRFLYYLTCDLRLKDIFEEVKDSDYATLAREKWRIELSGGEYTPAVRSGPDWSSFVSNWMTWYEITLDEKYRKRIETGIKNIKDTPFGFASGPDYNYDVETATLIYRGEEEKTPNQHLQICMGGPQIWLEVADMLEDDSLKEMLVSLGTIYFLSNEEKAKLTGGLIKERPFSWPMFATGIAALAAKDKKDAELAKYTWKLLVNDLLKDGGMDGYEMQTYATGVDGTEYKEIPFVTTNCVAQWCLNVIMCLEFIKEYLPASIDEINL